MGKVNKLAEVVFKGERRAVYRNRSELEIDEGDYVISYYGGRRCVVKIVD